MVGPSIRKSVLHHTLVLLSLLTGSTQAIAQTIPEASQQASRETSRQSGRTEFGWKWSISGNYLTIDSDAAASTGLGDNAFGLDLIGSYYFSTQFISSVGFGFLSFDDDSEFRQLVVVTDAFGSDLENIESTATAVPIFAELLYQSKTRSASEVRYRVGAGFSYFALAQREISNCTDCREDDLEIDGGLYATASVFYDSARNKKFGLSARRYLSGDPLNGISLWFEFSR